MEAGFLCAEADGWIDTLEATIAFFLEIAHELQNTRARRLLVVDRTGGVVPREDEFRRLVAAVEGKGFDGVRIAYVDVKATAVSRIEVGEIIARERGYEFRVFDNEALARIWLRYGEG